MLGCVSYTTCVCNACAWGACVECMKCHQPLGFLNGAIDHLSFFFFFFFLMVVFPKLSSYKPKLNKAYFSAGSMGEPNRQPPKVPNEKRPLNFYQ